MSRLVRGAQVWGPFRHAASDGGQDVSARHILNGHPERYRECSGKVYEVLNRFSPKLEMVSIDEAYVDMTGTERLHGPAMRAADALHAAMKTETRLNCSIGIGTSRLIAKICSIRPSRMACCGWYRARR